MKTIDERIAEAGITVQSVTELTGLEAPPEGYAPGARSFTVTLHSLATGESLTVPWHIGPASDAYPNEPDDVLDALASVVASYLNADGLEDWARDMGDDPDSRQVMTTYREVGEMSDRLRVFLGDDFDAFLWETEQI